MGATRGRCDESPTMPVVIRGLEAWLRDFGGGSRELLLDPMPSALLRDGREEGGGRTPSPDRVCPAPGRGGREPLHPPRVPRRPARRSGDAGRPGSSRRRALRGGGRRAPRLGGHRAAPGGPLQLPADCRRSRRGQGSPSASSRRCRGSRSTRCPSWASWSEGRTSSFWVRPQWAGRLWPSRLLSVEGGSAPPCRAFQGGRCGRQLKIGWTSREVCNFRCPFTGGIPACPQRPERSRWPSVRFGASLGRRVHPAPQARCSRPPPGPGSSAGRPDTHRKRTTSLESGPDLFPPGGSLLRDHAGSHFHWRDPALGCCRQQPGIPLPAGG